MEISRKELSNYLGIQMQVIGNDGFKAKGPLYHFWFAPAAYYIDKMNRGLHPGDLLLVGKNTYTLKD